MANIAVALAAGLALFAYAGGLADPAAAADTHYLALWATAVLLALAGLAVPPAFDLAGASVLVTTVVWVLPHGPLRGAAVGLLLTLTFAFIEIRHIDRAAGRLTWSWAIASALALQFLCRPERFLDLGSEPRALIGLVALPLLIAVAYQILQDREGFLPALLAVMTSALLVPGWSVTVALGLAAVATGIFWRDRVFKRWTIIALAALIVVAGDMWQPSLAWLLLFTMVAKAIPASWKTGLTAVAATSILLLFLPGAREWSEVIRIMALGPILLPALLLPSDSRKAASIQAFVLAVLALRTVDGPAALAAPLALAALSLRASAVAAQIQLVWTGALLGAVTLLGGYPWLRSPALEDALELFCVEISWAYAVPVVGVVWFLTFSCAALAGRSERLRCRPVLLGGLTLALLALIGLPPSAQRPFGDRIQVVNAAQTRIDAPIESPRKTRSVVVDTYLENSATLPVGTPTGRIVLTDTNGERRSWVLRAGIETGEWAARREDVANLPGFQAPPHWLAWVTPDGQLLAQRYRSEWKLAEPLVVSRVEIERVADVPDDVSLAVFHLELRR